MANESDADAQKIQALHPAFKSPVPLADGEAAVAIQAAVGANGNPCAGQPEGTPCFVWDNGDGTQTVYRCDCNGQCQPPGA